MTAESTLLREILRGFGARPDLRLFRNNTAQAWVGEAQRISRPQTVRLAPGDVVIRNARPLHAGLCPGSPDLVGWRVVNITPEMVGAKIAQFTGIEVKTGRQKPTKQQRQFLDALAGFGGVALVARNPGDLVSALDEGQT